MNKQTFVVLIAAMLFNFALSAFAIEFSIVQPLPGETLTSDTFRLNVSFSNPTGEPITRFSLIMDGKRFVNGTINNPVSGGSFELADCDFSSLGLSAGSKVLTVQLFDAKGIVEEKFLLLNYRPGAVLSEKNPPTVNIIEPTNGTAVGNKVRVRIQASDDTGLYLTQVYIDGMEYAFTNEEDFIFYWDPIVNGIKTGSHTIYAISTDIFGNSSYSNYVLVQVNNPNLPKDENLAPIRSDSIFQIFPGFSPKTDNILLSRLKSDFEFSSFGASNGQTMIFTREAVATPQKRDRNTTINVIIAEKTAAEFKLSSASMPVYKSGLAGKIGEIVSGYDVGIRKPSGISKISVETDNFFFLGTQNIFIADANKDTKSNIESSPSLGVVVASIEPVLKADIQRTELPVIKADVDAVEIKTSAEVRPNIVDYTVKIKDNNEQLISGVGIDYQPTPSTVVTSVRTETTPTLTIIPDDEALSISQVIKITDTVTNTNIPAYIMVTDATIPADELAGTENLLITDMAGKKFKIAESSANPLNSIISGTSYKVKSGDNLTQIAKENLTTVNAILNENPGLKADYIKINQIIRMPKPKVTVYFKDGNNGAQRSDIETMYNEEGYLVLSLRSFIDAKGNGVLIWIPMTKEVEAYIDNKRIKIKIGEKEIMVDNASIVMPTKASIIDGRTFVSPMLVTDGLQTQYEIDNSGNIALIR